MTNVAIERLFGVRIDLMFCVIETCLRHPAVDQNRFCDRGLLRERSRYFLSSSALNEVPLNVGIFALVVAFVTF